MGYWITCFLVFSAAYLLNIFYISVIYHRGLTHKAIRLHPALEKFGVMTGSWVTGLDPKGWSCMHRMHHLYSDTPQDPHSPIFQGVLPLFLGQLNSYNRTLVGLLKKDATYTSVVSDFDFEVNWLNRHKLWLLPYLFHVVVGVLVGMAFGGFWIGYAYWLGMMSHPIQGWMVNALAHKYGYRNFPTNDNSKNNSLVAFLVFGEGYQNNHHQFPSSPNFAVKSFEFDMGYILCRVGHWCGILELPQTSPLPA